MRVEAPIDTRPVSPDAPDPDANAGASRRRRVRLGVGATLLALGVGAALAIAVARDGPAPAPAPEAGTDLADAQAPVEPLDGRDVEAVAALLDASITDAMAEHDIPGGVFVLVADGRIAHVEGYGHTDLDRHTPIDTASTRFDIGSVSKLLTATAVMQQVEQGALDLHTDVNTYLTDLRVPDAFDEPVTLAHLLTHTGGFAEHYMLGSTAPGPGQAEPLVESLARFQPPRIRPPGIVHQYDNFGMALAGHLVENVTGRSFEEYVTGQILGPLGMTRSTYGRAAANADDVTPHEAVPGLGITGAVPHEYINMLPTGGLWTTGEDIAAFMLAHLDDGEHQGSRILQPDTVAAMHRTQFAPHPDVAGIGYGFFEHRSSGRRGVQHGGSWVGASAHLYLLPDADLGMFLAFNHGAGVELAHTLIYDALDQAFPVTPPPAAVAPAAQADSGVYAGQYRWNRHDRFTFMRLISTLTVARLNVTANDDGTLATTMAPIELLPDATWEPAGPSMFVEQGGTTTLVFEVDDGGAVTGLHVAGAQLFSMDRLAWHETTGLILGVLLVFLAVALVAAVGWPAGAVYRRLRRRNQATPVVLRRARRLSGLVGGLLIAFFLGLVVHFALDMGGLLQVGVGVRGLLWLPLISAALTVTLTFVVVRLWQSGTGSPVTRLYHSGIVLALLAFIPFLYHLRLLGFHY